ASIVTWRTGQPLLVGSIRVHNINLTEVGRIGFEALPFLWGELCRWKSIAQGTEYNFAAVRRIRAFRIVTLAAGEPSNLSPIAFGREDVHVLVIIPRVTLLLSRSAEVQFRFLFSLCFRIEMCGSKEDLIAAEAEKRASCFSNPARDAASIPGFEIQIVNLVKGISRLPLALEDQAMAVRREITLAGAAAFES